MLKIKQGMNFLAYSCFSCDFLSLNKVLSKSILAKHVSIYLFKLVLVFTTSKEIEWVPELNCNKTPYIAGPVVYHFHQYSSLISNILHTLVQK